LRKTHKDRESKYAHLVNEDGSLPYLTKEGAYAERPMLRDSAEEAAAMAASSATHTDSDGQAIFPAAPIGPSPKPPSASAPAAISEDATTARIVDITDSVTVEDVPEKTTESPSSHANAETLAGLQPDPDSISSTAAAALQQIPTTTEVQPAVPSFVGKTLVLGVGKRIQDEKHKIWLATVHDPYSFRGPEDRASGGGQKDELALQQNGAPKGWSAPALGEASVNQDENCVIC